MKHGPGGGCKEHELMRLPSIAGTYGMQGKRSLKAGVLISCARR
jgi:hypothetical protein